jgi:site-specific recombinase
MRRTAPTLVLAAASLLGFGGLVGCSSDKQSATTTAAGDVATPDGSFCSLLLSFRATNDALDAGYNSGDTAQTEASVKQLVSQGDLLRRKAPAEIKPDVDVVAQYVTALDQLLGKYDYDLEAFVGNEEASAEFLALTSDEVDSSLLQLRSYADTTCAPAESTSTTAQL